MYMSENEYEIIIKAMEKHNLVMKSIMNEDYDFITKIEDFVRAVLFIELNHD